VCERCRQATQEGGGVQLPLDAAALECASCDAIHIGSVDGDGPDPAPATQTIPPKMRRFVMHRDGNRCRVPGCRSAKHLDIHHIVHREDGGQHDPMLMIAACKSCHLAHHRGDLVIGGTAKNLWVERPNDPDARRRPIADPSQGSHVGPDEPDGSIQQTASRWFAPTPALRRDAQDALVSLGFSPPIARAAIANVPDEPWPIERVIREALRHCPKPI
jgi:RuvA, C-terminal domain/HNH endonuclease